MKFCSSNSFLPSSVVIYSKPKGTGDLRPLGIEEGKQLCGMGLSSLSRTDIGYQTCPRGLCKYPIETSHLRYNMHC